MFRVYIKFKLIITPSPIRDVEFKRVVVWSKRIHKEQPLVVEKKRVLADDQGLVPYAARSDGY